MSNSSRCPRIVSGVNRTLILILIIVCLEFLALRWYYMKPDQSRQREPLGRGPYLKTQKQHGGLTPSIMGGIDYAVAQINKQLVDREHSGFLTWPERPAQWNQMKTCQYYNDVAKAKRIVMKNVLRTPVPYQRDVTIVTQTSLGELDLVKRLLDHWQGHVSVAVHVRPIEVSQLSYRLVSLAVNTTNLRRLSMHLVIDLAYTDNYPVNFLRDIAFNASRTDRLFLLDMELVPSKGLHQALKYCDLGDREAVVVPAFQLDQPKNREKRNGKIETSVDLKSAWQQRLVQPLKSRKFPQGHRATRYSHWRVATKKYTVPYELSYEPYVLVQKGKDTPHFDPRFMNADWDRSSHIYALKRAGYRFTVLPKVFVLQNLQSYSSFMYSKYKECSRAIWARVTGPKALGSDPAAVKWKSETDMKSHNDLMGKRGEKFGKPSEEFGNGQKGKTSVTGLGGNERKPYLSDAERIQHRQNATKSRNDEREKKQTRWGKETIQQNGKYRTNSTIGGEERKSKFPERNQVQIITTEVKSNVKARKPTYPENETPKKSKDNVRIRDEKEKPQFPDMKRIKDDALKRNVVGKSEINTDQIQKNRRNITFGQLQKKPTFSEVEDIQRKRKNSMKANFQGGVSPFKRMKQEQSDKTNIKTVGEERKPNYFDMEQIKKKESTMKDSKRERKSPFSRMSAANDGTNIGKTREGDVDLSKKYSGGIDKRHNSKETDHW